jgi:hypothetical protein
MKTLLQISNKIEIIIGFTLYILVIKLRGKGFRDFQRFSGGWLPGRTLTSLCISVHIFIRTG